MNKFVTSVTGNVIGEGYVQVFINKATFGLVQGSRPTQDFEQADSNDPNLAVRLFNVDGVNLYSVYNKSATKNRTKFFMRNEDAMTRRADVKAIPFPLSAVLEHNIVATA